MTGLVFFPGLALRPNLKNLSRSSNLFGYIWNWIKRFEHWVGDQLEPILDDSVTRVKFLKLLEEVYVHALYLKVCSVEHRCLIDLVILRISCPTSSSCSRSSVEKLGGIGESSPPGGLRRTSSWNRESSTSRPSSCPLPSCRFDRTNPTGLSSLKRLSL